MTTTLTPAHRAASPRRITDFWTAVYGLMLRRGLAHHDAEDTTQSFFLKVARGGLAERWEEQAESDLHFQHLVFRGAANHCIDEHRKSRRAKRGGVAWHFSVEAEESVRRVPCARPTPVEEAELRELGHQMSEAIEEVGLRHAARGRGKQFETALPCLLDGGGEDPQRSAARALGLHEGGFRALLFRLRRELAGVLRDRAA